MKLGIDFGTTNSAVAVLTDGQPRIVDFGVGGRMQRSVIHCDPEGNVRYGNAAFQAYQECDLRGRFLRSLKAFLPQDVPRTTLGRERLEFTEVVGLFLQFLVRTAEAIEGRRATELVIGRPVRFHAEPGRHAHALEQLEAAIALAGISDYTLQLEPVAAAYRYGRQLTSQRIVLVGDFGGGTSDFAVLVVGPPAGRTEEVLGVTGVAKAGDAMDSRFMDRFLMGYFGRGATYRKRYSDEIAAWSHPITRQIQRLYYVHLLRSDDLRRRLERVEKRISDPAVIRRLLRLIFDDLGFPMAWAIEATKREFCEREATVFRFDEFYSDSLAIRHDVDRATFADATGSMLDEYRAAIAEVLQLAELQASEIDDVFLTGGSSQLPFVRQIFRDTFGADKLRDGDAFSSVCEGLVLSA